MDRLRKIVGSDLLEKVVQNGLLDPLGFDDDPSEILTDIDLLIDIQARGRENARGDPHGSAIAPLPDGCAHVRRALFGIYTQAT